MKYTITACIISLILSSCSTDLDVNAPYEETSVVYGLLNPADTIHYIKINKGFLGKADAYDMAQVADSAHYGDVLTVTIKENGGFDRIFQADRVPVNKGLVSEFGFKGDFTTENQYIYMFKTGASPLDMNATYDLLVVNSETGKEISASTPIVKTINWSKPGVSEQDLISFASFQKNPSDYRVEYRSAVNGRRYALYMTLTYIEENIHTGIAVNKTINWDLGERKAPHLNGGAHMERLINAEEFYGRLTSIIPELDGNTRRYLHKADFTIWIAGEELNTYMEVNEPSTGIIQEKPVYTNIENGIGIFSSRNVQHLPNKYFSATTANLLGSSPTAHPQYGRRFTHYWGSAGSTFQFIALN